MVLEFWGYKANRIDTVDVDVGLWYFYIFSNYIHISVIKIIGSYERYKTPKYELFMDICIRHIVLYINFF